MNRIVNRIEGEVSYLLIRFNAAGENESRVASVPEVAKRNCYEQYFMEEQAV